MNEASGKWKRLDVGAMNDVWTDGENVRRPLHAHTPAVHSVLKRYRFAGLEGMPRVIGRSATHEILSLVPGCAIKRPWPEAALKPELMREIGVLLRRAHETTYKLKLGVGERFAWGPLKQEPQQVVCHGDLGPWNIVLCQDRLAGIIDWDLARFGLPIEDIADVAVEFGPLRPNVGMGAEQTLTQALIEARVQALCIGYGDVNPAEVILHAPKILELRAAEMLALSNSGHSLFVHLVKRGVAAEMQNDAKLIRQKY